MRSLDVNNSLANQENDSNPKIDDLEVTIEKEQILTFHEEGQVERNEVEMREDEYIELKDLKDVIPNDVKGFLERPVHHADFEWLATSRDAVELIKEISLPRDWLKATMIQEKLQGFRYFKCNFKIRVQVNAQPFNAGYLMMSFLPLHEQQTTTPSSTTSFSGLTGYRRVMLDLSEDTSAEMTVPYFGLIDMFDLVNGFGYLGVVKLFVYSPLTGSDNVDGAVWITAEDVQVALPTGLPIVTTGPAQAGEAKKTQKDKKLAMTTPKKEKGVVSTVAETVGSIAGVLKDVPVIGSVASTVEWGASVVGDIASFFGFSKPIDEVLPMKETLVVANNFANYDGDCKAKTLSFFSKNETSIPTEVFGSNKDEMSFSHILSKPVFLDRFQMRKDNKQGTIIWKWPVDPAACLKILYNDSTKAPYITDAYVQENTYLSYLSNFFKYYRGTINYHLRIIKTCFHSGRIRIFVVPGATVDTDVQTIDFNKVHSTVYDIRDTTKFDIEVPYKWTTPWKAVDAKFGTVQTAPQNLTPNLPTAMVYVQVINALRNPSTAEDHIEFVVETSAGDDFQFALPVVTTNVQLVVSEESLRSEYPAQSAIYHTGKAHAGEMLDNAGGNQIVANRIAIGEIVTGWRTLLKRYGSWLTQTADTPGYTVNAYATTCSLGKTRTVFDYYSAAELLYRFVSGSVRIASKTVTKASDCEVITHRLVPHDDPEIMPTATACVLQSETLEPLVEISVPFYQQYVALPTNVGNLNESDVAPGQPAYLRMPMNSGSAIRSTKLVEIWRSTGEDFSFGYLIGPPKTIHNFDTQRCTADWKELLDQISSITFVPDQPATEENFNANKQKIIDILTTIGKGTIFPDLMDLVNSYTTPEYLSSYLKAGDPPGPRTWLRGINNLLFLKARNYLSSVCIQA